MVVLCRRSRCVGSRRAASGEAIIEHGAQQSKPPGAADEGRQLSNHFWNIHPVGKERRDIGAEELRIEDEDKQGREGDSEQDQHERQHGGGDGERIGKREGANHHHEPAADVADARGTPI
jgi:hypothetical protein